MVKSPSIATTSLVLLAQHVFTTHAFVVSSSLRKKNAFQYVTSTSQSNSVLSALSLDLEKPLGLILEEVSEGMPEGVKVEEVGDGGSASAVGVDLVGRKLLRVGEVDVTGMLFDDVMSQLIDAESPVAVEFDGPGEPMFEVGTSVGITVIQEGKETVTIESKVGENLRTVLLENKVELYRGLKKKMGNCGGGKLDRYMVFEWLQT